MKKELTIKKEIIMSVENYEHVKNIALELDAIANGELYKNCENDYDWINEKDISPEDLYNMENVTMLDYFSDCFDIKYTIGSDKETLYGVQIMIAFGGPNIYVDTNDGKVKLFWWGDYAEYELLPETIECINECFQDVFYC